MYHGKSAQPHSGIFCAEILIDGEPQDLYARYDGRLFVAGVPGSAYTLRVSNRPESSSRIEVLVSVDGRDVHEDAPADLQASHGLCIPQRASYVFDGFRVDDDTTRAFIFGGIEGSLADKADDTANTGVIGFAAYRENLPLAPAVTRGGWPGGQSATASASPGLTTNSAGTRSSLATHIGEAREDRVGRTTFERYGSPEILAIGYATREDLDAWGILRPADPDPFPGRKTGYARY